MSGSILNGILGLVPTSVKVWVVYTIEVMHRVVIKVGSDALKVCWPTSQEMKESAPLLE